MKKTPLRRVSQKQKIINEQRKEDTKKLHEFFLEIWNKLPPYRRVCYETGQQLRSPPLSTYFHHVLAKKEYPEYRLCEWNIVLLHPDVHDQAEKNIDKTPNVKAYREQLLNQL